MAIICPNGHINDEANRFCDQCGAPLQQDQGGAPSVSAASARSDNDSSFICAQCGQQNLPGTAFCDNCGAALPPPQPAQDSSAMTPTVANDMPHSADASNSTTVVCPQCGAVNDATNRFCDNCGRSLSTIGGNEQADKEQAQAMTYDASADSGGQQETAQQQSETLATPDNMGTATSAAPDTPEQQSADNVPSGDGTATAEQAMPSAAAADSNTKRQQLEEAVATQQQLVAQLEQMQATFGAATPAAVLQGLDEARSALAQAKADLQALPPAEAQVDPAEVARLEEAVATQQQLVAQLEQMQATFGAATPTAVLQGLDEARSALAQAKADLQALTGSVAAAPAGSETPVAEPAMAQAPAVTVEQADELEQQPAESATPEAQVQTASGAATQQPSSPQVTKEPEATPVTPAPPAPSAVAGPRLVTHEGQTIMLPRTTGDLLIGRQDPVSGVYPAVDLTPHNGEAGGVSRRHALLREQNGQWTITDLDSTNYTRINGNRIAPHTPTEIQDGAHLQLGRLELEFHTS